MKKRIILGSVLCFCAVLVQSTFCLATPIIYSVTDTGSGTLGATPFTNQTVTVSFAGDTSNVTGSNGFYTNSVGTGSVQIGNAPAVPLTDSSVQFFDNQNFSGTAVAGIGDVNSILDTENPVFATYTGSTAFPATSGPVFFNAGQGFATTAGTFTLTSAGPTSTFSATVVPEPMSLTLVAMSALGFLRRKRPAR